MAESKLPELPNDENNLNLYYHKSRLIIKAVNELPTLADAAIALGISDKTLSTKLTDIILSLHDGELSHFVNGTSID